MLEKHTQSYVDRDPNRRWAWRFVFPSRRSMPTMNNLLDLLCTFPVFNIMHWGIILMFWNLRSWPYFEPQLSTVSKTGFPLDQVVHIRINPRSSSTSTWRSWTDVVHGNIYNPEKTATYLDRGRNRRFRSEKGIGREHQSLHTRRSRLMKLKWKARRIGKANETFGVASIKYRWRQQQPSFVSSRDLSL